MEQFTAEQKSTNNNKTNSTTKKRGKTMKALSNTEKTRLTFQGNFKRKENLQGKIAEQKRIVSRKEKLVSRKRDGEVVVFLKKLRPAEVTKERSLLEKLKTELVVVNDSLKYSRFAYSKTNRTTANKFKQQRNSFAAKSKQKKSNQILRLIKAGKNNGRLADLKVISTKLKGKDAYSDQELKKAILPIINSYNNSIPITSLSKEAIAEVKEMLNEIK